MREIRADGSGGSRPFQFRLSYLLYLLTLMALGLAILRLLFDVHGGWQFNALVSVYVLAMTAYFAIRIPILIRRAIRAKGKIRADRTQLNQLVDSARAKNRDNL